MILSFSRNAAPPFLFSSRRLALRWYLLAFEVPSCSFHGVVYVARLSFHLFIIITLPKPPFLLRIQSHSGLRLFVNSPEYSKIAREF